MVSITSGSSHFTQYGAAIIARLALVQLCRKILLSPLISDLRFLSKPVPSGDNSKLGIQNNGPDDDEGLLPGPVLASSKGQHDPSGTALSISFSSKQAFYVTVSQAVFALCFSESCFLFVLVLCQSLDLLSSNVLLINWRFSLSVMLLLEMLVIPLLQSLLIMSRWSTAFLNRRSLLALFPYLTYLYLITLIPITPPMTSTLSSTGPSEPSTSSSFSWSISWDEIFTFPNALARLTFMGVLILGILSGFGAVRNTSVLVASVQNSRSSKNAKGKMKAALKADDITHAEGSLRRVRLDLVERKAHVGRASTSSAEKNKSGWMSSLFHRDEESQLRQEIAGLEALEKQIASSVEAMRARLQEDEYQKTFRGRMLNTATALFGCYCIYRMITLTIKVLLSVAIGMDSSSQSAGQSMPTDVLIKLILTTFPSLETSLGLTPERAVSLSRQVSLVLVGIIVLSSVRLVLRGVNNVLRLTSRNLGASFMLLFLAQLMGMYFLSTLIQLRSSFPPPTHADTPSSLFSTLPPFEVFGPYFDKTFVVSAGLSVVIRIVSGAFSDDMPWEWEMVDRK